MAYRFKAHVMITAQIICLSGLHIGGTEERYQIGMLDNPVVRDKLTGYPYIPGSSMKGKLRSLLEWTLGKIEADGAAHGRLCHDPRCVICRIFGASADHKGRTEQSPGPTRLIVRDAFPSEATLEQFLISGTFVTEAKTENRLNRITAEADPRQVERVPKGAQFDLDLVYGIYDMQDQGLADVDNVRYVYMALDLLEASVLGGGGSRGSGKIAIEQVSATIKTVDDYLAQASGQEVLWPIVAGRSVQELTTKIKDKLGLLYSSGEPTPCTP